MAECNVVIGIYQPADYYETNEEALAKFAKKLSLERKQRMAKMNNCN